MKFKITAIAAALLCCVSCVEKNPLLGGSLIPVAETDSIYIKHIPLDNIELKMADSLSGYSQTRITLGSVRDADLGLMERQCLLTLVPLYLGTDTIDIQKFISDSAATLNGFRFTVAKDTTSVLNKADRHIIQNLYAYELTSPLDLKRWYDINDVAGKAKSLVDYSHTISKGSPTINGSDSLSFLFSDAFTAKYCNISKEDMKDYKSFLKKYPGICLKTDAPTGIGGRINMFELQLDVDNVGNYAVMNFSYTGHDTDEFGKKIEVVKDSSVLFMLCATDFYDLDSLLENSGKGSYPQYCLNLSENESSAISGPATDKILIEGAGGIKPVITAKTIRDLSRKAVRQAMARNYGIPEDDITDSQIARTTINKATIMLPYEYKDSDYEEMYKTPTMLSPTCRIVYSDNGSTIGDPVDFNAVSFSGLTDSSNENENQGDIDRHNLCFCPDITYHAQELIKIKDSDEEQMKKVNGGTYDIWLLPKAYETITTTSSSSDSDLSEYYQYLAYQNYYNSMYGGGYGSYSGYGDSYSNYYTYMMAAMYASGSTTSSTSTELQLDVHRFYKGVLNGPQHSGRKPELVLTFSIPNIEK